MPARLDKVDIAICGCGVLGASTAYALKNLDPKISLALVDADPECRFSSSERNGGGVRGFWKTPINRKMSLYSIDFFKQHAEAFGFRQSGYLWCHREDASIDASLRTDLADAGYPIETFDSKTPVPYLPWPFSGDEIQSITFHPEAGVLNPNQLRTWFLAQINPIVPDSCKHLGWLVRELEPSHTGWKIHLIRSPQSESELMSFYQDGTLPNDLAKKVIEAERVVIALGAWSHPVVKQWSAIAYRCRPVARHIAFVDAPKAYDASLPMTVLPSGIYFHPEGGHLLVGYGRPDQPEGVDFSYNETAFFEDLVWPQLYAFSDVFESCKHMHGWAGMYSYSPDQNGILGPVGDHKNLFQIHSFTGRGVMMSPAAGHGLAEWIVKERFETLDLTALLENRFSDHSETPETQLL